jgi:hypothetical protein
MNDSHTSARILHDHRFGYVMINHHSLDSDAPSLKRRAAPACHGPVADGPPNRLPDKAPLEVVGEVTYRSVPANAPPSHPFLNAFAYACTRARMHTLTALPAAEEEGQLLHARTHARTHACTHAARPASPARPPWPPAHTGGRQPRLPQTPSVVEGDSELLHAHAVRARRRMHGNQGTYRDQ